MPTAELEAFARAYATRGLFAHELLGFTVKLAGDVLTCDAARAQAVEIIRAASNN